MSEAIQRKNNNSAVHKIEWQSNLLVEQGSYNFNWISLNYRNRLLAGKPSTLAKALLRNRADDCLNMLSDELEL